MRKTVAQLIEDEVSEKAARLYCCDAPKDTHERNYIRRFTPAQVKILEDALKHVEKKLFSDFPATSFGGSATQA